MSAEGISKRIAVKGLSGNHQDGSAIATETLAGVDGMTTGCPLIACRFDRGERRLRGENVRIGVSMPFLDCATYSLMAAHGIRTENHPN